jgi:D-3-phosphoglycerate dehydrogenase
MTGPRILVTPRSLTEPGLDAVPELIPLRRRGYELISGPAGRLPAEDELRDLVPGCEGWLAGAERISERVLSVATMLRVISRNGAGTDAIDVEAARHAGVAVTTAIGANARGVAELTVALIFSGLRHIPWTAAAVRVGRWQRPRGRELAECVTGVVGLGSVGRQVAALLTGLGAQVIAHDPFAAPGRVPLTSLDDLLSRSGVVTLHCPPPADGRPLLHARRIGLLPCGAVLINTAREALVDQAAVLAALRVGQLSAYAVDAYSSEPPEPSDLLRHERVIATPHLGGFTGASVRRATSMAVENLLAVLDRA